MKRPSFQFYPGDWLNDAALRLCSVPARGLWIEMMCLMHQGSEYGYLKVNHKVILIPNLARMVGATLPEVEGWVSELELAGVFSKDASGCVFSRRMIKDEKLRNVRASGGKLGGNPVLIGSKTPQGKVNHTANLKPTPSSSSSSSSIPAEGDAYKWMETARAQGADYTKEETKSAFLALSASGWMWGKNPVTDWRAALERQIQTDRSHAPANKPRRDMAPASHKGGNL